MHLSVEHVNLLKQFKCNQIKPLSWQSMIDFETQIPTNKFIEDAFIIKIRQND